MTTHFMISNYVTATTTTCHNNGISGDVMPINCYGHDLIEKENL